jgi:DNA repair photolyase
VQGLIVITKDARLLLGTDWPAEMMAHCTITGLGGSALEPRVPPPAETIPAYHALVERYGPERVVLRIDPVVPMGAWIGASKDVAREARGRVRISFLDAYAHVRDRFRAHGIPPPPWLGFHAPQTVREHYYEELCMIAGTRIEVCAEPGLPCSGCVGGRDLAAMGLPGTGDPAGYQRPACQCLAEKTEVLTRRAPCPFLCVYCYWKNS